MMVGVRGSTNGLTLMRGLAALILLLLLLETNTQRTAVSDPRDMKQISRSKGPVSVALHNITHPGRTRGIGRHVVIYSFIMIVYSHSQDFFRVILANYMPVQVFKDLNQTHRVSNIIS